MATLPLSISHGQGRSFVGRGGELINAFAQQAPAESGQQVMLLCAPGTALFATLNSAETVSAIIEAFGGLVCFTDASVYTVTTDGTVTRIGDGVAGRMSVATNGTVVCAVNGVTGLVVTSSTVTEITDPDFNPADNVVFMGGFFVFNETGSGRYFISDLYGTNFDALDFATAESQPDNLIGIVALNRELWLMGANTVEVHALTGASFPFEALAGVSIDHGCASPHVALKVDQSVVWLSEKGIVFQSSGYGALRISTHEIEEDLAAIKASWGSAYAWEYIEDGHQFYGLTVGDRTFVFDFATRLWHTRETLALTYHFAECMVEAFGKVYVGDADGRVRIMSRDYFQDLEGDIAMTVGSGQIAFDDEFFTTSKVQIETEVGQGAEARLEYSDTDGMTYSSFLRGSLGELGEIGRVVEWRRLGRSRRKRFRFSLYGNVRKRISARARIMVA